jgi:phosphatidylserine/phosphatidylglycerophosphate/cardiolipin synthase-like enzyme
MATSFLENQNCAEEIHRVIENANSELTIITPYIDLGPRMKGSFNVARGKGVIIKLITRWKKKLAAKDEEELAFFSELGAKIMFVERLHSKLFLNENSGVLSSMNMLDGSAHHSQEIGIFTNDTGMVTSYKGYAERLERSAMPSQYAPAKSTAKNAPSQKKKAKETAYCIRTGELIKFNIKMPYNKKSFTSWNRFKNPEFNEQFCHFSGEKSNGETSYSRPILKKNWTKAKKKFKF